MQKRILSLLIIVSIICSLNITAFGGGGHYFTFGISGDEAALIGFDEELFMQMEGGGVVNVPSTYKSGEIVYPVTRISNRVFAGCSQIDGVYLPDSIQYIDAGAFQYCYALTDFTVPDSVTYIGERAFIGCENLVSIELSEKLYDINASTFEDCASLAEITIPDSVRSIGPYAFWKCFGLTSAKIGSGVKIIEEGAFRTCQALTTVNIPASCEAIGEEAFNYCSALTDITFEEGLKTIGANAFAECESLSVVTLPDSIETLEWGAFNYNRNLSQINMPKNLKTVGLLAFYNCDSLKNVHIYDKVESIGERAYGGCDSLEAITVDENNANYCSLDGHLYNKNQTVIITYAPANTAASYTLPSTVTTIEPYAFEGARKLKEINLPAGLTTIGEYAFLQAGLTQPYIPAKVSSIGEYAFNCFGLTEVAVAPENSSYASQDGILYSKDMSELIWYPYRKQGETFVTPVGVTKIGTSGLSGYNLKTVIISEGVTTLGDQTFNGCENLVQVSLPSTLRALGRAAFVNTPIESMVIPEGVTSLYQVFQGCYRLKSVVLPASLTEIKYGTFDDEMENVTIYYRGSQTQWSGITIDDNNPRVENGNIIYNFTDKNNIAPKISGCMLAGNVLSLNIDYAHNVSGSTALIGIYDGNKLLRVETQYVNAGSTESTISVSADSSYAGKTVKVLFWDAPESMNNMCGTLTEIIK